MSIFEQSYLTVKEHQYLKSNNTEPNIPLMKVYENMVQNKKADKNEKELDKFKKEREEKERRGAVGAAASLENYLGQLTEALAKEGRELLFRDYMSNLFLESVYIDDDFKYTHAENIKSLMYDYIDRNNGYALLEAACKKQKGNKFLNKVKDTIDNISNKSAKRKTKALKEACSGKNKGEKAMEIMNQKHKFSMNDEETKEYIKARENLSEEEISQLVKDKVLDVVKDESEKQRNVEAFEEEMKEKTKEMTDKEKSALEESTRYQLNSNIYTDASLFEAINTSSMKEMVQESAQDEINMDLVMCESIAKYTLLELTYTMKLQDYNKNEIQSLCYKLMK